MGDLLLGRGEVDEAIDHFQKSLQLDDNFAEVHIHMGYALMAQGKEDDAIRHFLAAIRIDPEKSINAYYNLACIYAIKNKVDISIDWLKKAIHRGFNDWVTLKNDKDMENIRDTD